MNQMMQMLELASLARRQRGLTTVEYVVAGGLIALAVIGAFLTLGGTVGGQVTAINDGLSP